MSFKYLKHWKESVFVGITFYFFADVISRILSQISYFDVFLDASGWPLDPMAFWIQLIVEIALMILFMALASFWLFKKIQPSLKSGFWLGLGSWVTFYILFQLEILFRIALTSERFFLHPAYLFVLIPSPIPLLVLILTPLVMGWVLEKRPKK